MMGEERDMFIAVLKGIRKYMEESIKAIVSIRKALVLNTIISVMILLQTIMIGLICLKILGEMR